MKLLMTGLDQVSWMNYMYMCTMLFIPALIFISANAIFFVRTKRHPSKIIRWFSYPVFVATIITWMLVFIRDIRYFIQTKEGEIGHYYTFSLTCLASSMALIFIMGIIQALTMPAEKDWLDKYQSSDSI